MSEDLCKNCAHKRVCNMRSEYTALKEKLESITTLNVFTVKLDCRECRWENKDYWTKRDV